VVLTNNFQTLERDIDAFVETFGEWIETKGEDLAVEAANW
jgi:hypothetical protein